MLLQLNAAPYTAVISGTATLTSRLEPVAIGGVAAAAFEAGTVNVALLSLPRIVTVPAVAT